MSRRIEPRDSNGLRQSNTHAIPNHLVAFTLLARWAVCVSALESCNSAAVPAARHLGPALLLRRSLLSHQGALTAYRVCVSVSICVCVSVPLCLCVCVDLYMQICLSRVSASACVCAGLILCVGVDLSLCVYVYLCLCVLCRSLLSHQGVKLCLCV